MAHLASVGRTTVAWEELAVVEGRAAVGWKMMVVAEGGWEDAGSSAAGGPAWRLGDTSHQWLGAIAMHET